LQGLIRRFEKRMSLEPIFYGLSTGMVMSVMLGTVFFALIQNSIDNGFRSGIYISMGVIVSDTMLILITRSGAAYIPEGGTTENYVRIAGGIFLLLYGLNNFRSRKKAAFPETNGGRFWHFAGMGFLLNGLNPGNFIGWTAISTHITQVAGYSLTESVFFYSGALSAIFGMETLIALGASKLKRFITDRFLTIIDRIVGVIFIGFALYLILPFFTK